MKILMVCLGNICRSPLAEGILQSKVSDSITVDSAGTSGHHQGEKPDKRSIAVAQQHGIDITKQHSRKFTVADFDDFDVIYAMDDSNYHNLIGLSRNDEDVQKVKMILSESSTEVTSVPDPYYGGKEGFENVYQLLEDACTQIALKLKKHER